MLKTYVILIILLLLGACNNKLAVTVKSKNVSTTPEAYHLLGNLRSTFGVAGTSEFGNPIDPTQLAGGAKPIELSDGRRYHVAYFINGDGVYRVGIYKLDRNSGNLDTTFGTNGFWEVPGLLAANNEEMYPYTVELIKDRYVAISGFEVSGGVHFGFLKLFDTATDTLLTSFGVNGTYIVSNSDVVRTESFIEDIAYDQYTDQIVYSGYRSKSDYTLYEGYLAVLDFAGNIVGSFNGGNLLAETHASLIDNHYPWNGIIVTSTHYFTTGWQYDDGSTYYQSYIAKYDKSGILDPAFGTNGIKFLTPTTDSSVVTLLNGDAVLDTKDGNLLLAMTDFNYVHLVLSKIDQTTGATDISFGTAGIVDIETQISSYGPFGAGLWSNAIAFAPDGKLLMLWIDANGSFVSQFQRDGTLDTSFANAGTLTLPIPADSSTIWTWHLSVANDSVGVSGTCISAPRNVCDWIIE
jgi:hypothetical protein